MDATAPAQFVLKLPKSFARRLAPVSQSQPPRPPPPRPPTAFTPFTPSAPWTVESPDPIDAPKPARVKSERAGHIALLASVLAGVLVIASVAAGATFGSGPVGIAHPAPKSLVKHVRSSDVHAGFAPRVQAATVSIESLARPHHHRARHHHARR